MKKATVDSAPGYFKKQRLQSTRSFNETC